MKPFFTAIYFMPVRPAFHGSGGKISWECVIGYLAKGDFPGGYSNLPSGKPFVSILIMRDNEMGKIMTSLVPCKIIVHCFCILCSSARLEYTSGGKIPIYKLHFFYPLIYRHLHHSYKSNFYCFLPLFSHLFVFHLHLNAIFAFSFPFYNIVFY